MRTLSFFLLLTLILSPVPLSAQATETYRLRPGDVVDIKMARHEEISLRGPIASDGSVELQFIGTVEIAGLTRAEAGARIRSLYADGWFKKPEIIVNLSESRKSFITVSGDVGTPGSYPISPIVPLTLTQAIATAGDFTTRANRRTVLLIRAGRTNEVNVKEIINGKAPDIQLREGDQVRVKTSVL